MLWIEGRAWSSTYGEQWEEWEGWLAKLPIWRQYPPARLAFFFFSLQLFVPRPHCRFHRRRWRCPFLYSQPCQGYKDQTPLEPKVNSIEQPSRLELSL